MKIEKVNDKFSVTELSALRTELVQNGLDPWQAAELFQLFLAGRGYGVSAQDAIHAAGVIEGSGCSLEVMQTELDKIAYVM